MTDPGNSIHMESFSFKLALTDFWFDIQVSSIHFIIKSVEKPINAISIPWDCQKTWGGRNPLLKNMADSISMKVLQS